MAFDLTCDPGQEFDTYETVERRAGLLLNLICDLNHSGCLCQDVGHIRREALTDADYRVAVFENRDAANGDLILLDRIQHSGETVKAEDAGVRPWRSNIDRGGDARTYHRGREERTVHQIRIVRAVRPGEGQRGDIGVDHTHTGTSDTRSNIAGVTGLCACRKTANGRAFGAIPDARLNVTVFGQIREQRRIVTLQRDQDIGIDTAGQGAFNGINRRDIRSGGSGVVVTVRVAILVFLYLLDGHKNRTVQERQVAGQRHGVCRTIRTVSGFNRAQAGVKLR